MIPSGEFGRVCDVCGRLRVASRCRNVDRVWVCDSHPEYVSRIAAERLARPLRIQANLQIPDARPLIVRETLESVEADLLKFVVERAPIDLHDWRTSGVGGAETAGAAAWGALYLAELVLEDKRPYRWMDVAKLKLASLANWLVDNQEATTSSDLIYGGYLRDYYPDDEGDATYYTEDAGAAGLALLRAYQILGTAEYLDAAKRCAWFLRSCQCGGMMTDYYSSSDAAGATRKHWQMWTHCCTSTRMDHRYYPGDLIGYEFLTALFAECGDITIGSPTTVGTAFCGSREKLLSGSLAEVAGIASWVFSLGPSVTTYEYFDSYPADKDVWTGTGTMAYSDGAGQITSRNWAIGIRAMAYVYGNAALLPFFDWLAGFTSNPLLEQDAVTTNRMQMGSSHRTEARNTKGAYDAHSCPAVTLQVYSGGAVSYNADSVYDLAALGHLADFYSLRFKADLVDTRETIGRPQPKFRDGMEHDGEHLIPLLMGRCGLSLQPYSNTGATERYGSVALAAQAGRVFRVQPQLMQMRGIS